MSFIYKIYSGYDGFQPRRIPERLTDRNRLLLGWKRYLDEVQIGDEVWVYFHGPHGFKPGVYAKGRVEVIDPSADREVCLLVHDYDTALPLTDHRTSAYVATIVGTRGRQVFLFPSDWQTVSDCTVFSSADSCAQRRCDWCPTWKSFGRIREGTFRTPRRFEGEASTFVPAYWIIPPRCYLSSSVIQPSIRQVTHVLRSFKTGNYKLAYPLARAMFEAVREMGPVRDFDCVVPIPLSPDKAARGEIHRTRLLAQELSGLLGVPVRQLLRLSRGVSKRRMLSEGYTYAQFEEAFCRSLEARGVSSADHILLADDICTYGGTLRIAVRALKALNQDLQITAVVAAQMIVKSALVDEASVLA